VAVTVETAMSFYCKNTKRLKLKQNTASKLKPSLPQLVAIEKARPHVENNDHCSGA